MATNLDIDCLRTSVTIVDAGSFAEAADRVGRTPSTVSLQIGRLEDRLGTKLFQKVGRRMAPTPEGERLLVTARQVLQLNDQVVEALAHRNLSGEVAIGAIQDFADSLLPCVLARFAQAHPRVRITARVDRSKLLAELVDKGTLDLAIGVRGWSNRPHETIQREQMVWLGGADFVLAASRLPKLPCVDFALYRKSDLGAPAARLCAIIAEVLQAPLEKSNPMVHVTRQGRVRRRSDRPGRSGSP